MSKTSTNVLLILLDQVRTDVLGCYGGRWVATPNIDRLAREGIRFDRAYTTISICSPARASMFSGFHTHRHGMLYNTTGCLYGRNELADGISLISEPLLASDCRCGYAGKWHIDCRGPHGHGFTGTRVPGFGLPGYVPEYDEWLKTHGHPGQCSVRVRDYRTPDGIGEAGMPVPYGYDGIIELPTELTPAGFVAERTIDLLQTLSADRFFITASFWGPHHPALPNPDFAGTCDPGKVQPWPSFAEDISGRPRIQQRYRNDLNPTFSGTDWESWRLTVARHHDFLAMIDSQIGRILDALDALGLSRNTVVIFSSDHGDTLGCHGGQFDKGPYMFEETYRVPLLMRFPDRVQSGAVTHSLASNLDLYATILDLLGVPVPAGRHSLSLSPIREDPEATVRRRALAQFNGFDLRGQYMQRMLHTGTLKYVFNPGDFDELYDLEHDPYELTNVIEDPAYASVRRDLAAELISEMEQVSDPHARHAAALLGLRASF